MSRITLVFSLTGAILARGCLPCFAAFAAYFSHMFAIFADGFAAFATSFARFCAIKFMRCPFFMRRTTAGTGNIALLVFIHGGETTMAGTFFCGLLFTLCGLAAGWGRFAFVLITFWLITGGRAGFAGWLSAFRLIFPSHDISFHS